MATILTVLASVDAAKLDALKDALNTIAVNPRDNDCLDFGKVESIHFARFVIIDDGLRLVFSCVYDGTLDGFLTEFAKRVRKGVDTVFGCCVGYPAEGARDAQAFVRFMRQRRIATGAAFHAYYGVTVQDIHAARTLRDRLQDLLDTRAAEALIPVFRQLRRLAQRDDAPQEAT